MPIKPQSEMRFKPGMMSEESEFALRENAATHLPLQRVVDKLEEESKYQESLGLQERLEKLEEKVSFQQVTLDRVANQFNDLKPEIVKALADSLFIQERLKEGDVWHNLVEGRLDDTVAALLVALAKIDTAAVAQNAAVAASILEIDNEATFKTDLNTQ